MGILTRRDIRFGAGLVEYKLTVGEAIRQAASLPLALLFGGSPAAYMGAELEDISCCTSNPRVRVIVPLTDDQISSLSKSQERELRSNQYLHRRGSP